MNKKYFFLPLLFFLIIFTATLLGTKASYLYNFDYQDMLANIANIDISSLKVWQLNTGFHKNIAINDTGSEVKILQKALSTDTDIYPEKNASGYFGPATERAVKAFQKENSLPETGAVDRETKDKLNDIFYRELCPIQTVEYRDYTDFIFAKDKGLPIDFVPKNLKRLDDYGVRSAGGIICLREDALVSLKNMFDAALLDGISLAVSSGFRTPVFQQWLINNFIRTYGENRVMGIAPPGHSEHQLGTAVDLTGKSINFRSVDQGFAESKESIWLAAHAGDYGFVLSYPAGNTEYIFEPWHYRFWGAPQKNKAE